MARVTVEDCIERVPNRFDLVMLAAQRARNLGAGAPMTLERDRDKMPVVALREIAAETVAIRDIRESLVRSLRKVPDADEPDLEAIDIMNEEINLPGTDAGAAESDGAESDDRRDAEEEDESPPRPKSTGLYADEATDVGAGFEAETDEN